MQLESVPFEEFNQRIGAGDFDAVMTEFIVGNSREPSVYVLAFAEHAECLGIQKSERGSGARRAFGARPTIRSIESAFRRFQLAGA